MSKTFLGLIIVVVILAIYYYCYVEKENFRSKSLVGDISYRNQEIIRKGVYPVVPEKENYISPEDQGYTYPSRYGQMSDQVSRFAPEGMGVFRDITRQGTKYSKGQVFLPANRSSLYNDQVDDPIFNDSL